MKRSEVNNVLYSRFARKKNIVIYSIFILLFSISAIFSLYLYIHKNKKEYVTYSENSNIDYQVYLKENNFFKEKYLGKNNEYIASLIDYIKTDFNYDISLNKSNTKFDYDYRVESEIVIINKNGEKPLYNYQEVLLEKQNNHSNNNEVVINEPIIINYNYYNDIVKSFKDIYDLTTVDCVLNINMYINVKGLCDEFDSNTNSQSVISLSIPLTSKTMSIAIDSNLANSRSRVLLCKTNNNMYIYLIVFFILLLIDSIVIIKLAKYIIKTRTSREIYKKELKKILNNYHSYIQRINNNFDLKGYQVLKVDTFTDLLEIRDVLQQPILMVENEKKGDLGVYFIIPSNTKLLYTYGLNESDIEKGLYKKEN